MNVTNPTEDPKPPPNNNSNLAQPQLQQPQQYFSAANPYAAYYQQVYGMQHPYYAWYQSPMGQPQSYPFAPMTTTAATATNVTSPTLPPGQPLPPWHVSKRPNVASVNSTASASIATNSTVVKSASIASTIKSANAPIVNPIVTKPPTSVPIVPPIKVEVAGAANPRKPHESKSLTDQWPPSLKEYVGRCFAQCSGEAERDRMETHLRKRIQRAIEKDRLHSVDWSKEPIVRFDIGLKPPSVLPPQKEMTKSKKPSKVETIEQRKNQRSQRFQDAPNTFSASSVLVPPAPSADVIDWDQFTIVGTCQTLEKPYLRLTSAPDPRTVRPLPILREALEMVREKWKKSSIPGNTSEYGYCCDQLKSIRQDLTVQRIKNDFTVRVYEVHARLALEQGDLGEYNQCQGQLRQLYDLLRDNKDCCANEPEFAAYRLLYLLLHTRNQVEVSSFMNDLESHSSPALLAHSAPLTHALRVRAALSLSNYHRFFQLYREAPNMAGYLMDAHVPRQRISALTVICRAYRPSISVGYLEGLLAFSDQPACRKFLTETVQACWWPEGADARHAEAIDAKQTLAVLLSMKQQ